MKSMLRVTIKQMRARLIKNLTSLIVNQKVNFVNSYLVYSLAM